MEFPESITLSNFAATFKNMITRRATINDLPTLLQFEQGVIKAERPFDSTLKRVHTRYYDLNEMISAPHIELIVAELNGKLVGSVMPL